MKKDNRGFTLAELLIVMAIILVLAAIAIPNFTKQLESSRETADINALRAAYSEAMTSHMLIPSDDDKETIDDVKLVSSGKLEHVKLDKLPFTVPDSTTFDEGTYSVTFDFSADPPTVALAAKAAP